MRRCEIFFTSTSFLNFHLKDYIARIKEEMAEINFYSTNMVDNSSKEDTKLFLVNFNEEVKTLKPKIIILFGSTIYRTIWKDLNLEFEDEDEYRFYYKKHNGIYYVPIKNPLGINNFREEIREEYIKDFVIFLSNLLEKEENDEL